MSFHNTTEALEIHSLADLFPVMSDDEYAALKADIQKHGLLDRIVTYDSKILDGRHRYRACQELGIRAQFTIFTGNDPIAYVVSKNQHRRHLTAGQKAAVASEIESEYAKLAENRMKAGKKITGNPVENFPQGIKGKARDHAAKQVGANPHYVTDYKKIKAEAPAIAAKVMQGAINIPEAKELVKYAPEKAEAIIQKASDENITVAKAIDATNRKHGINTLLASDNNEWYTPSDYIEAARRVMGSIDLDPASSDFAQQTVNAGCYHTILDDGLNQEWHGNIWLNPPYGRDENNISNQNLWTQKLIQEYSTGKINQAILLVNAVTGNKWFQPLWDYLICFTDHRIQFYSPDGKSPQPTHSNALVYFGNNHAAFIREFSAFGVVVKRVDNG